MDLEKYWQEGSNGIQFQDIPEGSSQQERLEMLYYEGVAENIENGYFIPYDKIVQLSEDDAELLALPEKNPYQLSITANGTVGYNDLYYVFKVLQPNGEQFVNPVINGCMLHIDEDRVYRLNEEQYKLVCLMKNSNHTIPNMDRKEIMGYSLVNLARIQRYADTSETELDVSLNEDNQKIIVPENLDIEFTEDENGNIQINPVILEEGSGQPLEKELAQAFQTQFAKERDARTVYKKEKEGKKVKIVCPPAVKEGLAKIKNVNRGGISEKDKERYEEQPRELFDGEIFKFRNKEKNDEEYQALTPTGNPKLDLWDSLPPEGELYSDRVKGLSDLKRATYYGSGQKTDWITPEGETKEKTKTGGQTGNGEVKQDEGLSPVISDEAKEDGTNNGAVGTSEDNGESHGIDDIAGTDEINHELQVVPQVLDIEPNFEREDYYKGDTPREGILDKTALKKVVTLYDYQEKAIKWMYKIWCDGHSGVLLADDMGLGKTLQTLAFLAELKKGLGDKFNKPVLIVGPTALLKNWESEYEKFVSDGVFSCVIPLHGSTLWKYQTGDITPNGKKKLKLVVNSDEIVLTTYETLRDYQFSFAEVEWGIIIADEAQKIKNPSTGITIAIKAMKYDYAICLSGTPVENSWVDLWSIMDFVKPLEVLGTLDDFRNKYINRLKTIDNDVNAIEVLGQELQASLNPFLMRRMKQDKLPGLPRKTVHIERQEMPTYQKNRYEAVINEARQNRVHPLITIAKMRDISLHPDIGTKQIDSFYEMTPRNVINQSARLIKTFDILNKIRNLGEKALIFVVSKKMQLVLRHLIKSVFSILVSPPINGEMNGTARQNLIDKFNNSEGFSVLILSPEAAGVGFTITAANHVIHLSRTWNPAKEDQATDRVYRIGQKKDVHVYLPIACYGKAGSSFDEKLNELLEYKRQLSNKVMFPTPDDPKDGKKIFNDCVEKSSFEAIAYSCSLTIEDIDCVVGDVFEEIVTDLYKVQDVFKVSKTPHSNDRGADVIVLYDNNRGLLVQCKHKAEPSKLLGLKGIQEVYASVNYYKNLSDYRGIDFETAVITNACGFTDGARKLAKENGVKLIARGEMKEMLHRNPIPNKY